jgi:hypothetical protein
MKRWLPRIAACLSLLLVTACTDCVVALLCFKAGIDCSGVKATTDTIPFLGGLARGAGAPENSYVAVRAKKGGAGSASFDVPVDLWGPFDVSVTWGVFDESTLADANGARGCVRTENLDFSDSFGVCAERQGGGITVTADATSGPVPGSVFLGGATRADLRIQLDGTTLTFSARENGAEEWQEVDTATFTQEDGLRPFIAAALVPTGAGIGVDDLRIRGGAPPSPTAEDAVAHDLALTLADLLDAIAAADQAVPDTATATDLFASAGTHLDAAATGAAALTSKAGKKAKKKIAAADKALGKAAVAFSEQKTLKGTKAYGKGVGDVLAALDLLLPDFEL